jgi:Raf kinase inhibitor-like YbhB/YbcL family protein
MVRSFFARYNAAGEQMILSSPAFKQNHLIPRRYTSDGEDVSPALSWSEVPPATKELALLVEDPDAPTPEPWVHWILYRIPPATTSLAEHILPALRVAQPAGALQGKNSWPKGIGYRGPAPPKGHGLHHYHFRLYALDVPLDLEPGLDKAALVKAMRGHILAEEELIGTYQR